MDSRDLYPLLHKRFSLSEIKELCLELQIEFENLPGETRQEKARELIIYCARRGRIHELVELCRQERPNLDWPETPQLRPISNFFIPFKRNRSFVGRAGELARLQATPANAQADEYIPVGLTGMGGIGKTQLAVEYAYRCREEQRYPEGIFWVNAAEPLAHGFARIGRSLRPELATHSLAEQIQHAFTYLGNTTRALVILDNLTDLSLLDDPVGDNPAPAALPCCMLFTTRQRYHGDFAVIEVADMPKESAMELVLNRANRQIPVNDPEYEAARQICHMLGYLPLALQIVGAFLKEWPKVDFVDFLERLVEDGRLKTLEEEADELRLAAVEVTLKTQWDAFKDEVARTIFRVVGQLPEAVAIPVPQLGLLAGVPGESGLARPSLLERKLRRLEKASLLEVLRQNRVRLHPLIHEFAARLTLATEQENYRLELEDNVIDSLRDPDHYHTRAITAGNCLLDPPWPAMKMQADIIKTLRIVVNEEGLPALERRRSAFLLIRLRFLDATEDVSPDEMLVFLERIIRFVDSPLQRHTLVHSIDHFLELDDLSEAQRIQFLVRKAQLLGQLYEFLDQAVKEAEGGQPLIQEAEEICKEARRRLSILVGSKEASSPQDHKLRAHIFLNTANILGLRAEASTQREAWENALLKSLDLYLIAAESARAYKQDHILRATVYSQLSYTHGLLSGWEESEKYYLEALQTLDSGKAREEDREDFVRQYALILNNAGLMHWQRGQRLDEDEVLKICSQYRMAYEFTMGAITFLEEFLSGSRVLIGAHYNAGDYLLDQYQVLECRQSGVLDKACEHWHRALDIARKQGNWNILRLAEARVKDHCQNDGIRQSVAESDKEGSS